MDLELLSPHCERKSRRGAVHLDPQWSGEGSAPDLSPPAEDPCTWLISSTPVQEKLVLASPLPTPPTLHAARAACPPLASPQSSQSWKGLKIAAQLGKLTSVLQPLLPLLLLQSPPRHVPLLPKRNSRMMPCAIPERREWSGCLRPGQGPFRRLEQLRTSS